MFEMSNVPSAYMKFSPAIRWPSQKCCLLAVQIQQPKDFSGSMPPARDFDQR